MSVDKYRVVMGVNIIIAEGMSIETACLLVKAYFEQFYEEPEMKLTIERMTI